MKKNLVCLIALLFALVSCVSVPIADTPKSIPMGEWKYKLLINGLSVGEAVIKKEENAANYITTKSMSVKFGTEVIIELTDIITETKAFVPIKYDSRELVTKNNISQDVRIISEYKGKNIVITSGNRTRTVALDRPFIVHGNYFMHSLIQQGFQAKCKAEANVYIQTSKVDETSFVDETIVGLEKVSINGQNENLIHSMQYTDGLKTADIYMDNRGIIRKMNFFYEKNYDTRFEMIIKE